MLEDESCAEPELVLWSAQSPTDAFRTSPVSSYSPPPHFSQPVTIPPPLQGRQCAPLHRVPVPFQEGLQVPHPFLLAYSASLLTGPFLLICKHTQVSPML